MQMQDINMLKQEIEMKTKKINRIKDTKNTLKHVNQQLRKDLMSCQQEL